MFTGLVEDVGTIVAVGPQGRGIELTIRTAIPMSEVALGDSIAVDGACLTVESMGPDRFVAVAGRETLERTTLRDARAGRQVHLERALRLGDRLGGHIVQGHVDGLGRVVRISEAQESVILWIEAPSEVVRYVAPKGSITVDGVSLTVNEVDEQRFRVNVVPHTARVTRLGRLTPGAAVNLEVDVLAKYVERLLGVGPSGDPQPASGLTLEKLTRFGFGG